MFKTQILAALKIKFPGMSTQLLGSIADKMAVKITAEDQIQGGIAELDNLPLSITDYATILQTEGDRRATAATQTHEQTLRSKYEFKEKAAPNPADPNPADPGADNDLKKQLAEVNRKLANLETRDQKQALQDSFMKKLSDKKIPISFARGRMVESADQIDTMLTEAEAEYAEVRQGFVNSGLGVLPIPVGGEGRTDNVDADIAAWAGVKK